jgi:hypothetical protein
MFIRIESLQLLLIKYFTNYMWKLFSRVQVVLGNLHIPSGRIILLSAVIDVKVCKEILIYYEKVSFVKHVTFE